MYIYIYYVTIYIHIYIYIVCRLIIIIIPACRQTIVKHRRVAASIGCGSGGCMINGIIET